MVSLKYNVGVWFFLIYLLCFQSTGFSQENLFFSNGLSQSSLSNPAIQNKDEKLVIGVPFLSGINVDISSEFAFNYLFSNDLQSYSLEKFYTKLGQYSKAYIRASELIFYSSLKKDKWNFSFSFSDKAMMNTRFNREIIGYLRDGNLKYYGDKNYFGDASFSFNYYREISFGISKNQWKNLDLGIRPKLLFGKLFFNTGNLSLSSETDEINKTFLLKPAGDVVLSGPFNVNHKTIPNFTNFSSAILPGDYFLSMKNLGMAVDLGLVYRRNKRSEISFSIVDFGFTGYKNNLYEVDFINPVSYPKDSLYQSAFNSNDGTRYVEPKEALKAFGDSLSYAIEANLSNLRRIDYIPLKFNLSTSYKLNKSVTAGFANQLTYQKNFIKNYFSAFARYSTKNENLELTGILSLYNLSGVLPGMSVNLTSQNFQFYLFSNNILSIIRPVSAKHLNLSFGINFLLATGN